MKNIQSIPFFAHKYLFSKDSYSGLMIAANPNKMSDPKSDIAFTYISIKNYFIQSIDKVCLTERSVSLQNLNEEKNSNIDIDRNNQVKSFDQIEEVFDVIYVDQANLQSTIIGDLLGPMVNHLSEGGIIVGGTSDTNSLPLDLSEIRGVSIRYGLKLDIEREGGNWCLIKEKISISFIVPCYNCSQTIAETLDSILDTNLELDDEIILVDDGSTDATRSLLESYRERFPFIKLISHPKNRGGAYARNTAVENAKNPLIFCLDSDNVLEENSIKQLKYYLISSNADIAAFQCLYFFRTTKCEVTHKWVFNSGSITLGDSLSSEITPISSGNYLFTKASWESAGGYPLFSRALDAWGFGLRQLGTGHKMIVLEKTGYFHRYGHPSYWVREQSKGDTSILALQLLAPFIGKLEDETLLYILSSEARNNWFENLRKRPLKLNGEPLGSGGMAIDSAGKELNPIEIDLLPSDSGSLIQKIKFYLGMN